MSKKIYIIEDDANLLYSLRAKFSIEGFKVETNSGSSEIEEIINDVIIFKPDYIILDLILPRADGFSILSKIKSKSETSGTPVFVFTNLSDEDSRSRSKDLGSDYYFMKSDITIDEFVEKIKKIISNRGKRNES